MKRTLLLSNIVPGSANVGQIFIRDMLACEGIEPVVLACLAEDDGRESPLLADRRHFPPPREFAHRTAEGWRGTAQTLWDRQRRYEPAIRRVADDVRRFVRQQQPGQVWAILSSTAAIDVAWRVSRDLECPLVSQVWDDPLHLLRQRRLDRLTQRTTLRRFDDVLGRSSRVAVISEPMAEAYAERAGGPCVIVRHGVDDVVLPRVETAAAGEFRIGFSGGMYAETAWRALQRALDQLEWRIGNRQVVLIATGSQIRFDSRAAAAYRFFGWQPEDRVSQILAECDLLYLPQPFDSIQEPLARLSFPTKLSTYVSTGRPVFVHTPSYGSLTPFCREHDFGLVCHDLDPAAIAGCLQRLDREPGLCRELAESTARVGSEVLTKTSFQSQVLQFLMGHRNVPDSTASPDPSREFAQTQAARV